MTTDVSPKTRRAAPSTCVSTVITNFNLRDQLLLRASKLVGSGRQSAVAVADQGGSSGRRGRPTRAVGHGDWTSGPNRLGSDRPSNRPARGCSRCSGADPDDQQVIPTYTIASRSPVGMSRQGWPGRWDSSSPFAPPGDTRGEVRASRWRWWQNDLVGHLT